VENDVNKVVHEVSVEADLGLDLVGDPQHLVVKDLDVAVHITIEELEDPVWTHQIVLEELREGLGVAGEQVGRRTRPELGQRKSMGPQSFLEPELFRGTLHSNYKIIGAPQGLLYASSYRHTMI